MFSNDEKYLTTLCVQKIEIKNYIWHKVNKGYLVSLQNTGEHQNCKCDE